MFTQIRCSFCEAILDDMGDAREVWIPVEGIADHLEQIHPEKLTRAERWPDGELVIINEDELNEGLRE